MTTLKERFDKILPLIVENYNNFIAEAGEIGELDIEEMISERLLPFFRQELLALAEEVEAIPAETTQIPVLITKEKAAALIRSKADELV